MLPDIDSTFFHILCGNLIVSKGSLYVYLLELDLRNLLYVINSYIESKKRILKKLIINANGFRNFKRTRNRILYCLNKYDKFTL